jgi:hypothetical protein
MKRLTLYAVAALLTVTSCGATFNTIRPVTGTSPVSDNTQTNCALAPALVAVPTNTVRLIAVEWWQAGAMLRSDTLTVLSGKTFTVAPPVIPGASDVTVYAWAYYNGTASCRATLTQTPVVTTVPPAAPTLTVAP